MSLTDSPVVDAKRPLVKTTEQLLGHLADCPTCSYNGGKYCLDVDGYVNAVKRAQVLARKAIDDR